MPRTSPPDRRSGIGTYTLDDFRAVLYDGVTPDGRHLYPAMPYPNYRKLSEKDVRALYDYFMHDVAPVASTPRSTDLGFPFNQRWALRLWNLLALPEPGFRPPKGASAQVARGAYIVEGPGHCGTCHTPRSDLTMGQQAFSAGDDEFLTGGRVGGWTAPALAGRDSDIAGWSAAEITQFLAAGHTRHSAANGEMARVVEASLQYLTDSDVSAISAFLASLNQGRPGHAPPQDHGTEKLLKSGAQGLPLGPRLYLDHCTACHAENGKGGNGGFPELPGDHLVTGELPTGLVSVILYGGALPATARHPDAARMSGFGDRLTDGDVAALASFLRSAWGNDAGKVTTRDVARVRRDGAPAATIQ